MAKREADMDGTSDDGKVVKRRKEDSDVDMADTVASGLEGLSMKEQGLMLWQIIKDAVNKEGRNISLDFIRKPSRRQYPDYYVYIQKPIALEDIKKKLEINAYPTLEAVKDDLELCFNNAKQYNRKDSYIWKSAKDLLKLTHKTYKRMIPHESDEDKKNKPPSLNRMLKSRLQKLIEKADENGRILSSEFMELPSKKDWPIYYKQIKHPECLENIFKRIKRKEYPSASEFANDVELVFSNALTFNQEHTVIWEDALTLRDYFRQLMSDLPEPFALPQYVKPTNNKIKIKMPAAQPQASSSTQPVPVPPPAIKLRVAPPQTAKPLKPATPPPPSAPATPSLPPVAPAPAPAPVPTPAPAPTPAPVPLQSAKPKVATPQTQVQPLPQATTGYYPNASYSTPVQPAPATTPIVPAAPSVSNTPTPEPQFAYQLQRVVLKFEPDGRTIHLDSQLGVKNWSVRLGANETGLCVENITFTGHDEDESSEDEDDEDGDEDDDVSPQPRRKRKGRGRPPRRHVKTRAAKKAKKKSAKLGEVQVKVDGTIMPEQEERSGSWSIGLTPGMHTIELGEKGGLIWKIYAVR